MKSVWQLHRNRHWHRQLAAITLFLLVLPVLVCKQLYAAEQSHNTTPDTVTYAGRQEAAGPSESRNEVYAAGLSMVPRRQVKASQLIEGMDSFSRRHKQAALAGYHYQTEQLSSLFSYSQLPDYEAGTFLPAGQTGRYRLAYSSAGCVAIQTDCRSPQGFSKERRVEFFLFSANRFEPGVERQPFFLLTPASSAVLPADGGWQPAALFSSPLVNRVEVLFRLSGQKKNLHLPVVAAGLHHLLTPDGQAVLSPYLGVSMVSSSEMFMKLTAAVRGKQLDRPAQANYSQQADHNNQAAYIDRAGYIDWSAAVDGVSLFSEHLIPWHGSFKKGAAAHSGLQVEVMSTEGLWITRGAWLYNRPRYSCSTECPVSAGTTSGFTMNLERGDYLYLETFVSHNAGFSSLSARQYGRPYRRLEWLNGFNRAPWRIAVRSRFESRERFYLGERMVNSLSVSFQPMLIRSRALAWYHEEKIDPDRFAAWQGLRIELEAGSEFSRRHTPASDDGFYSSKMGFRGLYTKASLSYITGRFKIAWSVLNVPGSFYHGLSEWPVSLETELASHVDLYPVYMYPGQVRHNLEWSWQVNARAVYDGALYISAESHENRRVSGGYAGLRVSLE